MTPRRAKTRALSRFLEGDAAPLKALKRPNFPRDPLTGDYDYRRMNDEQLTWLMKDCYDRMTEEEKARCHPNMFRDYKDLTDAELDELLEEARDSAKHLKQP